MVGQKRGLMLPWWAPWVSDLKRVLKFLLQLGLWHLVGLKTTWEKQVYARDLLQMQSSPALASKQHCNELWPLPLSVIFPHTNHRWDACREHFLCPGKFRSWKADIFSELYHCLNLKEKPVKGVLLRNLQRDIWSQAGIRNTGVQTQTKMTPRVLWEGTVANIVWKISSYQVSPHHF